MKDEITITKKEMSKKLMIAGARASAKLGEKSKKPQVTMVANIINTLYAAEVLKILFDEDTDLEIVDDV